MKVLRVEREKSELESKRLRQNKRAKRRRVLVILGALGLLVVGVKFLANKFSEIRAEREVVVAVRKYEPQVPIVDEGNAGISERIKNYVGMLERDLAELGFKVEKVMLPAGKIRELDVYLAEQKWFFKVSIMRGTAETAEDIMRMMKYIDANKVNVGAYVDVRLTGRGYYK